MSAWGLPGNALDRQTFLARLESGDAALQALSPGIKLCTVQVGARQGLSLQIAGEALQAGQLQRVLQRRFEQAVAFEGCFAYLDGQRALVIWHALPAQRTEREATLSRMLSLANLEALDGRMTR